jgi:hypothetical protein
MLTQYVFIDTGASAANNRTVTNHGIQSKILSRNYIEGPFTFESLVVNVYIARLDTEIYESQHSALCMLQ